MPSSFSLDELLGLIMDVTVYDALLQIDDDPIDLTTLDGEF